MTFKLTFSQENEDNLNNKNHHNLKYKEFIPLSNTGRYLLQDNVIFFSSKIISWVNLYFEI